VALARPYVLRVLAIDRRVSTGLRWGHGCASLPRRETAAKRRFSAPGITTQRFVLLERPADQSSTFQRPSALNVATGSTPTCRWYASQSK
jgi:hypothetical protein